MNAKGFNGISRPKVVEVEPEDLGSAYLENLYRMPPIKVTAVFDAPTKKEALVIGTFDRSSRFFELLNRVCLSGGTVLEILRQNDFGEWDALQSAPLARLIAFMHRPGYKSTATFRGFRIALERQPGGVVMWKSAANLELLWKAIGATWTEK